MWSSHQAAQSCSTFCRTPTSERTDPERAEAGCFSDSSLFHKINTVKITEAAVLRCKHGWRSTVKCFASPNSDWLHSGRPSVSLNGSGWWKCLAFLWEPQSDRLAATRHTAALRATVTHGNTTPDTTTVYSACSFMYKYSVHIYIFSFEGN